MLGYWLLDWVRNHGLGEFGSGRCGLRAGLSLLMAGLRTGLGGLMTLKRLR